MSTLQTSRKTLSNAAPLTGLAAAAALLLGVATLPIGYYSFERWVVFVASIAALAMAARAGRAAWALLTLPTALIWNPVVPVYLGSRAAWLPLDLIAGIGFIAYALWAHAYSKVPEEN